MTQPFKVIIVDDHPFFRQGVKLFLSGVKDLELIGEYSSGEEALENVSTFEQAHVILMDLQMRGIDGIAATTKLISLHPELRILILTSYGSEDKIREALQAGVAGYCLKDAPPEELVTAIQAVAEGGTYLGRGIDLRVLAQGTAGHIDTDENSKLLDSLTQRELDVLKLLAKGYGNKQIAEELFVSEKTVKTHVANVLHKLEVTSRTQAALLANQYGIS
ncbi:DNA-binding response regulator [Bacillus sp. HMF5848]|uniref:LuxR C-terminal-related transcriptional regulator n=1 Tax=Bacillus sp. HMF5848 TaxID=2495421 RepID=UPI000F76E4B5|nr:response regulator transcription factor [Bacillus sp. HMF5848]RSK25863.1 DNA-binding response regulator [Bacillus sp. HMF5848]